jgi:hypothetical protein
MNNIGARGTEPGPDLLTEPALGGPCHRDIGCILPSGQGWHDLLRISKTGFEWGFDGPAPAQLALALLADHLGDGEAALRLHRGFMREVVAHLDNAWRLTGADIDAALGRG